MRALAGELSKLYVTTADRPTVARRAVDRSGARGRGVEAKDEADRVKAREAIRGAMREANM